MEKDFDPRLIEPRSLKQVMEDVIRSGSEMRKGRKRESEISDKGLRHYFQLFITGDLVAEGYDEADEFPKYKEVPREVWECCADFENNLSWVSDEINNRILSNRNADRALMPRFENIRVWRKDAWEKRATINHGHSANTKRGGRKPLPVWDEIWLEMLAMAYEEGLPMTQAEFINKIEDWCSNRFDKKAPRHSSIKARVSQIYRRLGWSE